MPGCGVLAAVVVFSLLSSVASGQTSVKLTTIQIPEGTLGRDPVQVVVTVDADVRLSLARLVVTAPKGFELTPVSQPATVRRPADAVAGMSVEFSLDSVRGPQSRSFMVQTAATGLHRASYRMLLDAVAADTVGRPARTLAHETVPLSVTPEIKVGLYLCLGLIGAAIGYAIRFLVKVQSAVTAPSPAPVPNPPPQPGPITRWVQAHYYLTDSAVTLTVAFFALLALLKDGRPPDGGATWYGALGVGLALGLLTNSELITRFKPPT